MKLAQGEYVALEKIENVYSGTPLIAQIYVHGDSLQSYLIGIVVPDPVQLSTIVAKVTGETIQPDNVNALEQAIKNPEINAAILQVLTADAKRNGLKGSEYLQPALSSC